MFNNNFTKRILQLHKQNLLTDNDIYQLSKNKNTTIKLMLTLKNIDLDNFITTYQNIRFICSCSELTIDLIKYIHNKKGNVLHWFTISYNKAISINDIENNLDLPWDWHYICENKITIDFIKKYKHKCVWKILTVNKHIKLQDIENNLDLPWCWNTMPYCSPKILEHIKNNLNMDALEIYKDYDEYNFNVDIIDFIMDFLKNKTYVDNFMQSVIEYYKKYFIRKIETRIHVNKTLNINFIKKYETPVWNWFLLSKNVKISMYEIENNPDISWNFNGLLENKNLTIDFIRKNLNKITPNDWIAITKNKAISMQDIENNLDLPWNWSCIEHNHNLTFDFLIKNKQVACNLNYYNSYIDHYYLKSKVINKNKKQYMELLFKDLQLWFLNKNKSIFNLCMHEFKLIIDDFKIRKIKKNNYQDNWLL